ncbi:MAG TPA: hypothetical protein VGC84_11955, partial [Ilumatobacteraceae bacterium]
MMRRTRATAVETDRDQGAALILALVMMILAAIIVIPALDYTMTVTRTGRGVQDKVLRAEAVKGGLRTVLADGKGLYQACKGSGLTTPVTLASPGLDVAVSTKCTTTLDTLAEDPNNLWYAGGTTWAGSVLPAGMSGTTYAGSGNANPTLWWNDTSPTSDGNKVWAPQLPVTPVDLRSNAGFGMPSAYGACRVFFPGKYTDPLTLTANSNYYFVSGVYYFENTLRISGDAKVVVGLGAVEGCTDDLDAVSYADYSAPFNHNQTGAGATFVFGGPGRLVVDNATAATGTGPSLTINKRLVAPTETGVQSSEGVSIMSVNGTLTGTTIGDLNQPQIYVPAPIEASTPPAPASGTTFKPSTLVPTVAPAPAALPIVDINLSGATTTNVDIESYIAVPQGTVSINTVAAPNKTVKMVGGVLGATINVSATRPASF